MDEVDAELAGLGVRRVLFIEVSQGLEPRMPGQAGVIERDLRVQADQTLERLSVRARLGDDRQGVHFDQIRVVGPHRGVQALGDGDERIEEGISQADGQPEAARLEGQQAQLWVGRDTVDRARVLARHFLDLDAALRRSHQHDPAAGSVDDGTEVVLLDDLGSGTDQHLADGDPLDVHPQNPCADLPGLSGARGQLHSAGLAAAAHENLGLDDHATRAGGEEALGRHLHLIRVAGHFPGRHGQSLGEQERLRVGFLDLHAGHSRYLADEGRYRIRGGPRCN